ncbi:response regulator transcription factor [Lysobacter changpingensis]|jgi:FixJ family two-component response regulator|uniref:response regulator transcription factor n=1 Tax=Lysobacter changpingensis TaxID=2792784 RepID=UPI001A8F1F2A|nr:response regulator [Lysobacter changpingensis]
MAHRPLTIAVVDDEEDVRHALHRLLRSAGFEVLVYATGSEFLRHARESAPNCVVLDLHMGGLNGFDVQNQLHEWALPLPVVVLTGNDTAEGRKRALDNGARAFLSKPVDDEALIGAILAAVASPGPGA